MTPYTIPFLENWPWVFQTGLGSVGKSFDVFGDGSVVLINTPGHTHGMFSARISSGEQYLLLSGDTTYTQESISQKRIPGFTVDKQLAKRSLDWIFDCARDPNCILIAANHDPQIPEQVITLQKEHHSLLFRYAKPFKYSSAFR